MFPFPSNSPRSLCESLLELISFSDSIDNACLSSLVIRHHTEVSALIFSFIVFRRANKHEEAIEQTCCIFARRHFISADSSGFTHIWEIV